MIAELPYLPPEAAFAALADTPGLAFLDSAATGDPRSRVSYLCLSPRATLRLEADPYATLRNWMASHEPPPRPEGWPFPFAGGAVGWIGYDLARESAGVPSRFAPMPGLPGGWFGLYTTLLGFDRGAAALLSRPGRGPARHCRQAANHARPAACAAFALGAGDEPRDLPRGP